MRQLALGVGANSTNECCRLGELSAWKSVYKFCRAIGELFDKQCLRKANSIDFARLLEFNENRGFWGMFASPDCMHYELPNCMAWAIHSQEWEEVHCVGGDCTPQTSNLACFLWPSWTEQ